MPTLTLTTNVAITDTRTFLKNFSEFAAKTLAKPEEYIMVNYVPNPDLIFKGTFEPAFILHITSLGNLSPELNEGYSKMFSQYLGEKLGLKDDRGYLVFDDPGNAYMGYQSTTFEAIFRK